jgi:hypothetical protein
MIPIQFPARDGVKVSVLPANRFKAGMLSVSSVVPITEEGACLFPLLLSVLRRGTEKYPTLADLNRRLDYLWGTGFSIRNYYRGNLQVIGFSADLLDPVYLPSGAEDLLGAVLALIREILYHPVLDPDGLLSARYVESEKELQCDAIRAAKICLEGYTLSDSILFFMNPRLATNNWISKNRPYAFTIGNHDFYN